MSLAASLEKHSEHPLAAAIVAETEARKIKPAKAENFESITGRGITGVVDGKPVSVGSNAIVSTQNDNLNAVAENLRSKGRTVMFVAVDGKVAGLISMADVVKPAARAAIKELHRQNIEVVMMTGDNRATADAVAKQVGIDQVFAEVMPEDKAAKGQGSSVAGQDRRDGRRRRQ